MPESAQPGSSIGELVDNVVHWIRVKLEADEGFSVLLVTRSPAGKGMSKYSLKSVEEALVVCERDLRERLSEVTEYALAYDAWIERAGKLEPAIILQLEDGRCPQPLQYALFYQLVERDGRKVFQSDMKLLGMGEVGSSRLPGPSAAGAKNGKSK